ncbi:MAG TPA: hypothetical protein VJ901_20215 [Thermoanaerobaculia bacterium]|nr:hypothetical protein [Thermoanaerobaculia bacterium]
MIVPGARFGLHLHVHSLRSGDDRDLGPTESRVEIVGDVMVSTHEGALVAQHVDKNLQRIGTPVVISPAVWFYRSLGFAEFSVSPRTLVYATPAAEGHATWLDRSGAIVGTIGPNDARGGRISRDGRHITMPVMDAAHGTADAWIADISRASAVKVTNTPWSEGSPLLSPDGQFLAYSGEPDGPPHIFMQSLGGTPQAVTAVRGIQYLNDWSPDGTTLLFRELDPKTNIDLWTVAARPNSQPVPLLRTPFNETNGRRHQDRTESGMTSR